MNLHEGSFDTSCDVHPLVYTQIKLCYVRGWILIREIRENYPVYQGMDIA